MEPSDKIIIEDLKRIILMQTRKITQLKAQIDVIERELNRYKTKKIVATVLCPRLKMRTGHHVPAVSGKRVVVKQEDNLGMKGGPWR